MSSKVLVALVGQPNCGKSTVFNMLTGARQHVANYPGVTVEKKTGAYSYAGRHVELVDLPGTYALTSFSLEEKVARGFLVHDQPAAAVSVNETTRVGGTVGTSIVEGVAVKPAGSYRGGSATIYDAHGGIIAPGLVDPHIHIESSMVTACAYAEAALLNGTTTIFCDSHEIGNVMDVAGVEAMMEDAREAPLSPSASRSAAHLLHPPPDPLPYPHGHTRCAPGTEAHRRWLRRFERA